MYQKIIVPVLNSGINNYRNFTTSETYKDGKRLIRLLSPLLNTIKNCTAKRPANSGRISFAFEKAENIVRSVEDLADTTQSILAETNKKKNLCGQFRDNCISWNLDTTVLLLLKEIIKSDPNFVKLIIEDDYYTNYKTSYEEFNSEGNKDKKNNSVKYGIHEINLGLPFSLYFDGTIDFFEKVMTKYEDTANLDTITKRVFEITNKTFWKDRGNHIALMFEKGDDYSTKENVTYISSDNITVPLESEIADKIFLDCKSYMDKGINRCFLLYGPPGTGKTTAVQKIVSDLGKRSVRLTLDYLARTNLPRLYTFLQVLKPDVLILDDFDRLPNQNMYLDMFQEIRKFIPVILLTANNIKNLNTAIKRPGRIDRIYTFKKLDTLVYKKILGEFYDRTPNHILEMPVSFIQEFAYRCQHEGIEEAIASFGDLWDRFEENLAEWQSITEKSGSNTGVTASFETEASIVPHQAEEEGEDY